MGNAQITLMSNSFLHFFTLLLLLLPPSMGFSIWLLVGVSWNRFIHVLAHSYFCILPTFCYTPLSLWLSSTSVYVTYNYPSLSFPIESLINFENTELKPELPSFPSFLLNESLWKYNDRFKKWCIFICEHTHTYSKLEDNSKLYASFWRFFAPYLH